MRWLLAVQAQDPGAWPLALRARGSGFGRSDAVGARELVRGWLMRGTLHVVCGEDWWWLHALTARRGVERDAASDAVVAVLEDEGPLERHPLIERLAARGLVLEGQAFPHLLARCCALGDVVMAGERFVLARDWVGTPPRPVDRDAALRELGVRYARAHPGAGVEDLAAWSGLGLRAARTALAGVAPAAPLEDDDGPLGPRLLPALDPLLLGWRDRTPTVPDALARRVHPGGGMLRPVALDDGLVAGTWGMPRGEPAVDAPDPARFAAEAADVRRFEAS